MVAVVFGLRPVGLAEVQLLVPAHLDARHGAIAGAEFGGHSHDLRIERTDARRGANGHIELDIGDAERDAAETSGVRLMASNAIAPWAYGLDIVVVLREFERGAFELPGDRGEPRQQRLAA